MVQQKLSKHAGILVANLHNALAKQYADPDDPEARELGWFRGPDVVTSAPDKLRVANRHRGPTETRRRRPRSNTNGNTQAEIAALYATSAPVVMKTV